MAEMKVVFRQKRQTWKWESVSGSCDYLVQCFMRWRRRRGERDTERKRGEALYNILWEPQKNLTFIVTRHGSDSAIYFLRNIHRIWGTFSSKKLGPRVTGRRKKENSSLKKKKVFSLYHEVWTNNWHEGKIAFYKELKLSCKWPSVYLNPHLTPIFSSA